MNRFKGVKFIVLSCCKLVLAMCMLLSTNQAFAEGWQKIIVVLPQVTFVGEVPTAVQRQMTQTSNDVFKQSISAVKGQLSRYFVDVPPIEYYQADDFYQNQDSQGQFFLKQLAPSNDNVLLLFGHFEYDSFSQRFNLQLDGYDGKNSTDWLVLMSPFDQSSLSYLKEIYVQLVFELLNEPTPGLKLIKSQRGQ